VEARTPRANDRGVGEDGNTSSFKSVTLPHYMCRFAKVTEALPPLYLHGLSSGDFVLGLGQSFGNAAGLSAATITRLTERCFPERVMLWLTGGPLRTWMYLLLGRL
jgi:putative transposase